MKARTLGFVAGLGLLAPCASGNDSPPAAPSPKSDVASEVLRGFAYPSLPPARIAVPVITATEPAPDTDTGPGIITLAAFEVNGKPDQTFRDVTAALAEEKRSIPCDLFVRKIGSRFQLRDLGPPLPPMDVETPSERLEANFPLITLAW